MNISHQLQTEAEATLHIQTNDRLKPGSKVKTTLYSTLRDLGEYVVSGDGKVNLSLVMPKDVEPGQHTIVLDGVSDIGKSVTYYGFVAVAAATSKGHSAKGSSVAAQLGHQSEHNNDTNQEPQNTSEMDRNLLYSVGISFIITGGVLYVTRKLKH